MLVSAKTQHIEISQLAQMGIEVICPSIWQKIGIEINPIPLSSTSKIIERIKSLPERLKNLLAAVPIKGDLSALEFGVKANSYAIKNGLLHGVAWTGCIKPEDNPNVLGRTPPKDHWSIIIKEALPGSRDLTRDQMQELFPANTRWISGMTAYISIALRRLQTNNADSFFWSSWVRTALPNTVVGGCSSYVGADIRGLTAADHSDYCGAGLELILD